MKKLLIPLILINFAYADPMPKNIPLPWSIPKVVEAPVPPPPPTPEQKYVLPQGMRTPSDTELNNISISMRPSATPVTEIQQQNERLKIWQTLEEQRLENNKIAAQIREAEAKRPQVVVIKQEDPVTSGILFIPRVIGAMLGK